jgi:structural maintenance of chromosome 1
MNAFKKISENIDKIYKELTGIQASTASLQLENEDEPYLEGIKYNAIPPNKRFRDMEQLSGGEKTIAALALLFAIHSFQPAPFFVLDEVDAALDPINVAKVVKFIQKKSSAVQCIVISLKNSFFEKADALIGIYKDTEGQSSKTLTLDLRNYES